MEKPVTPLRRLAVRLPVPLLIGMLTAAFGACWYAYYNTALLPPLLLYTAGLCLLLRAAGGLRVGILRRADTLYAPLLAVPGTNLLTWLLTELTHREPVPAAPIVFLTLVQLAAVFCWTVLTEQVCEAFSPPLRLAAVCGGIVPPPAHCPVSGILRPSAGMLSLKAQLLQYDGAILYDLDPALHSELVHFCLANGLRVCTVPSPEDILLHSAREIRMQDTPLLQYRPLGLTPAQRAVKRSFDILFSLAALVLLWPVMLLCGAAVKICDGGSILYRQERLTEGGRVFLCLKFRSMIPDAEPNGAQLAGRFDPRITPVGAVLRRFRLDELPQLLNILRGDMSVVGPRPERPELAAQYEAMYPDFRLRLTVRAGLTGLAQVMGAYDTPPLDKLRMDLMYITRYSLLKDVEIILLTAKVLLMPPQRAAAPDGAGVPQKGGSV